MAERRSSKSEAAGSIPVARSKTKNTLNAMGLDSFELFSDTHVKCKTCGAEVMRGIISISGHWVECTGKKQFDAIQKINKMPLNIDDKMDVLKNQMNINQ